MSHTRKRPDERRAQILAAAAKIFETIGYEDGTIDMILEETRLSKGAFYHYFESKEALLEALVAAAAQGMVIGAEAIRDRKDLSAIRKIELVLASIDRGEGDSQTDALHHPDNIRLHVRIIKELTLSLSRVMAAIVEEGRASGEFTVDSPLETVQFLLCGGQFLLDGAFFDWTDAERATRLAAFQSLCERSLGATAGSFHFIKGLRARSDKE